MRRVCEWMVHGETMVDGEMHDGMRRESMVSGLMVGRHFGCERAVLVDGKIDLGVLRADLQAVRSVKQSIEALVVSVNAQIVWSWNSTVH